MMCLLRFEDAAVDAEASFILGKEQLRHLKAMFFHPRWLHLGHVMELEELGLQILQYFCQLFIKLLVFLILM